MAHTLYFYDLETSGFSARDARIMQFAGQRTDENLQPIGEPDNILVKITPDILPEPDAVLITGITPQKTLSDGITEAEFLQYFHTEVAKPGTVFVGFNTVRFDDEFIRYTNYRNFYDAYEWQWQDNRSRWDIMDVARMTRALRPDGIKWPVDATGKSINKLEPIAAINNLEHEHAHDALSDVMATIGVAKLIRTNQPKLFDYLFSLRDKKEVQKVVGAGKPFVYTSGRYSAEHEKTTIAYTVAQHPTQSGSVYVYDLRHDPTPFLEMSVKELAALMQKWKFEEGELRLPVKQLQFNKCPAVAPLGVLDTATKERLHIDDVAIAANLQKLTDADDFGDKLKEAVRTNEKLRQGSLVIDIANVDSQLYDGFFNDGDKNKMRTVRTAKVNELADLHLDFADERLNKLLLLYKARQYPNSLSETEQQEWDTYREQKLFSGEGESRAAKYLVKLEELSKREGTTQGEAYLLEELALYAQSIAPYSH